MGSLVLNQRSLFRVMRPPTACVPGTQCLLSQQGSYKPLCAIWTSPGLGIFTRLEGDSGCAPHGFSVYHMDSECTSHGFRVCIAGIPAMHPKEGTALSGTHMSSAQLPRPTVTVVWLMCLYHWHHFLCGTGCIRVCCIHVQSCHVFLMD